jgi:hypothetical protein
MTTRGDGTTVPGMRRTWSHPGPGAWRPLFVVRLACGCWVDTLLADRMWEPCMAHETEGHLSVLSTGQADGVTVARCLVSVCPWQESWAQEIWAVDAAVRHWEETRSGAAVQHVT